MGIKCTNGVSQAYKEIRGNSSLSNIGSARGWHLQTSISRETSSNRIQSISCLGYFFEWETLSRRTQLIQSLIARWNKQLRCHTIQWARRLFSTLGIILNRNCIQLLLCLIIWLIFTLRISSREGLDLKFLIGVKNSLGALRKKSVGIELDWSVTLGTGTLVRVKSARVTTIWIGDRYIRWMKLFMSMTKKESQQLVYVALSRVICYLDRLVGLVVSMSDYWSWGRGFDPRHFHKF